MTADEQMAFEAWIHDKCRSLDVEWNALTPVERSQIMQGVPCTIRCWRVGVPIDVKDGEKCSECGATHRPAPLSRFDLITSDD